MVPGVEVLRSLTGLWGEFMYKRYGIVRVLDDSAAAIAQVKHGMDSQSALRTNGLNFTPKKPPTKDLCGWTAF